MAARAAWWAFALLRVALVAWLLAALR